MVFRSAIRPFLLLPSFLCLDAPLVAAGWALILRESRESSPPALILPLFFGVWAIYLADRLSDAKKEGRLSDLPLRHQFARQNTDLLTALLALNAGLAIYFTLAARSWELALAVAPIAVATVFYFILFRVLKRKHRLPPRLPWKESLIAFCYASGVSLSAVGPEWITLTGTGAAMLVGLVLVNCLLISHAESKHDQAADPEAFFAHGTHRAAPWIYGLLAIITIPALTTTASKGTLFSPAALLSVAALLGVFHGFRNRPQWVQAASDTAMLAPWAVLACRYVTQQG
ncbi:MAG: hypothetical protein P1U87_06525 [Verrucomicrobiales bacterium]|nr:hypothetical protein [Verrucomicrobiales bacterium]